MRRYLNKKNAAKVLDFLSVLYKSDEITILFIANIFLQSIIAIVRPNYILGTCLQKKKKKKKKKERRDFYKFITDILLSTTF